MTIQLRNLRLSYPESRSTMVLDIPSWSVSAGEKLFLHGPSGCGKSSLLALISGMLRCDHGEITVFNQRLDLMSGAQRDLFRANHIGYVFQQFNLIPYLSAVENVCLANHFFQRARRRSDQGKIGSSTNKANHHEASSLLRALGINEALQLKPAHALSIGQQQRVAIARAMINQPQLVIADEPTSSLDQGHRDAFMELLLSLVRNSGAILVFVSHDLSLAHYFDRSEPLSAINLASGYSECS